MTDIKCFPKLCYIQIKQNHPTWQILKNEEVTSKLSKNFIPCVPCTKYLSSSSTTVVYVFVSVCGVLWTTATSHQLPATNHQPPATSNQPPRLQPSATYRDRRKMGYNKKKDGQKMDAQNSAHLFFLKKMGAPKNKKRWAKNGLLKCKIYIL